MNANMTRAIQHADRTHRVYGVDMKPGFLKGFDEADRRKDVRRISVQESSAPISVRPAAPPDKGNHARHRRCDAIARA